MKKIFLFLFLSLGPLRLFAWLDMAHMVVAEIAYQRLSENVKLKVDSYLQVSAADFPDSSTFVTASCWSDDIKSSISAFNAWHISSLPFDPCQYLSEEQKEQIIASFQGKDLIFALTECTKTLSKPKATEWAKEFMLRQLIHYVGDIHQPLHCTSLYDACFPCGDRGGNDFFIVFDHQRMNLHYFWDAACGLGFEKLERPLNEEGKRKIAELAKRATAFYPESCFDTNFCQWRDESHAFGETEVYCGLTQGGGLSADYIERGQEICLQQIAKAGYHLAYLLECALKAD